MAYTGNISIVKTAYESSKPTTYDFLRPNAFWKSIKFELLFFLVFLIFFLFIIYLLLFELILSFPQEYFLF